jgi:hypothetical protein
MPPGGTRTRRALSVADGGGKPNDVSIGVIPGVPYGLSFG